MGHAKTGHQHGSAILVDDAPDTELLPILRFGTDFQLLGDFPADVLNGVRKPWSLLSAGAVPGHLQTPPPCPRVPVHQVHGSSEHQKTRAASLRGKRCCMMRGMIDHRIVQHIPSDPTLVQGY